MPDSVFVELYAGLWARLFGLDRYTRKSSPGQMSLFGEHDVSQEPRDAHGEWTAGGPQKSEKPDVVPAADVATLRQDETKPASGDTNMAKQPWELRADEYRKIYDDAKTDEQRKALRDAGFIGNWRQQIFEAVKAGKDVPEQLANGVVSVVEYRAKQALRAKYGEDYPEQLAIKAANVHPIHDIVRTNEDGSLTVRRQQGLKGAFHEHKKGDVVVMVDGTGQIVEKAKKPYKLMTGQGLYGYCQDITVRPPKKTEEQTVRQAIAAKSALDEDQHQSRNQDYADLKQKQMDKFSALVAAAFE